MKSLKNPMTNAIYIALITAIYAIIFIVSSEFIGVTIAGIIPFISTFFMFLSPLHNF